MEIGFECSCDGFACDDVSRYNFARLFAPSEDIALMKDPDEQVIPDNEITLIYSYPFKQQVKVNHKSDNGFDRASLIRKISEDYHRIYRDQPDVVKDNGYKSELEYLVLNRLLAVEPNTYDVDVGV